jgi:AraC-like DNA-binding protein
MRYQKFPAAQVIRSFVECYFICEGEAPDGIKVQSPPSGFSSMVFNYGDPYYASQNDNTLRQVPRAFVSGQFTSNYWLEFKGKIGMAGVVLKPTALHNFFGLRMSQFVNSRVPIFLLPGLPEEILWTAVNSQSTDGGRIKILEELMHSYLAVARTNVSIIDEAADYIDACKGCVSVEAVSVHLKISRRYLEKKFLEKVGVSPKFYARIKRFGALSNKIAHNEKVDWQEIVVEYGFHDQSHLVKEFMEFNQMNPSQYHLLHREMTRFVKQ